MLPVEPMISLVVPCYKVAEYLPAFLRSIDAQYELFHDFEVVFVIDGCPEGSGDVVEEWRSVSRVRSVVITTPNRGVSAARNTGIAQACGSWLSFPDPDDELSGSYLAEVAADLQKPGQVDMLMTRMIRTNADVTRWHRHVLEYKYDGGSRDLDLNDEPEMLQLSAGTAFFRREVIDQFSLTFDSRLKVFEDGKFVADYLLSAPGTKVRICSTAVYFYKTRPDNSGALASSSNNFAERFQASLKYAYPELAARSGSRAPLWLEYVILYDLYWLFVGFLRVNHPILSASPEELRELDELARDAILLLSVESLMTFNALRVEPEVRSAWLAVRLGRQMPKYVRQYRVDRHKGETEYRYLTDSKESSEQVIVDGLVTLPRHTKWRSVVFFGEVWLYERIMWVESGDLTRFANVTTGDSQAEFANVGEPMAEWQLFAEMGWNRRVPVAKDWSLFPGKGAVDTLKRGSARVKSKFRKWRGWWARNLAILPIISSPYRNAWLLMDRDSQANDNGESLIRFIHKNRTDINAWFVVRKSSPDYRRLRNEGIPVLPYLGIRHFIALRNCSHLISSHIDQYVVKPFAKYGLRKNWNYVFLQHGVTKDALERWLNTKDVQLLVASTVDEAAAFRGEDSRYIFTDKEILLSEMPRYDQFHEAMLPEGSFRSEIVISPTWRKFLLSEAISTGNARGALESFASSSYVQRWSELLASPELRDFAQQTGRRIVFLPHPNLEPHIEYLSIPNWVTVRSYSSGDATQTVVNSALLVTDYSSIAFDAAFCRTPSVYFQFDAKEFFSGGHIASKGYFEYERDGFGPVASTTDSAVQAIKLMLSREEKAGPYLERIEKLYPYRDGNASRRIVAALENLGPRR